MPHVSTDGPARPPYVNVAFQREEIELERGGVLLLLLLVVGQHCHMCTLLFFYFLFI